MNYPMLSKLKKDLEKNNARTPEEEKLLEELNSLNLPEIFNGNFSLGKAQGLCPVCGK